MLEFQRNTPLSKEDFMKLIASTLMAGAFLAVTSLPVLSDGHIAGAIKARQALMTLYAANLGALGAMAKGDVEYKAEAASAAANNLQALVNLSSGQLVDSRIRQYGQCRQDTGEKGNLGHLSGRGGENQSAEHGGSGPGENRRIRA